MIEPNSVDLDQEIIKELIRQGFERKQRFKFKVTSLSMAPMLQSGDNVIISPVNVAYLKPGDMVVITQNKDLIIHRLTTIRQNGTYLTKGDSLPFVDPPLNSGDILGQVVVIEKKQLSINLAQPKWIRINRILGIISKFEANIIHFYYRNRKEQSSESSQQESSKLSYKLRENHGLGSVIKAKDFLQLPFQFLIRTILFFTKNAY